MISAGQWIGKIHTIGLADGIASLSIEAPTSDRAFASIWQGAGIPAARVELAIKRSGNDIFAKSVGDSLVYDASKITLVLPKDHPDAKNFTYSSEIEISGRITESESGGSTIEGRWSGNSGVTGTFMLNNSLSVQSPPDEMKTWDQYKSYVSTLIKKGGEFLFRGQASSAHRLISSFHRTQRYDLIRYRNFECTKLAREINTRLGRRYDLRNGTDFGAVLSLAQHHGFPTPLLDWTFSPYIAAYFALSSATIETEHSRIFVFDSGEWSKLPQPATISDPTPTVSVREFEAFDNPRHMPQQACHTFTNVADVQAWIRIVEEIRHTRYLTTIDIPKKERATAIRDLRYMGVTASSLFPGLDGTCRALKDEFFPSG